MSLRPPPRQRECNWLPCHKLTGPYHGSFLAQATLPEMTEKAHSLCPLQGLRRHLNHRHGCLVKTDIQTETTPVSSWKDVRMGPLRAPQASLPAGRGISAGNMAHRVSPLRKGVVTVEDGDSAPSGACAGAVCPKPQTWHFPFRAAGRLGIRDLSYPHCHFLSRLHHILHCSGRWSPWLAFGLALSPCPDLQSLCTCTQQVRAPHRRRSSGAARRGL